MTERAVRETWAKAAAATASHQPDHLIEHVRERLSGYGDATERLSAALSEAERERDEARLAYGEAIETQRLSVTRASALEALLAECATVLDVFARHSSGDATVIISTDAVRRARALLAKLNALREKP
jgi:hypothetical protein